MLRKIWMAVCVVAMSAATAQAQQIAFTFDDLPAHGPLPEGVTRTMVAGKIIAAIQHEKMPSVYGMVNAALIEGPKGKPEDIAVLEQWRKAGMPLASHGWQHLNLDQTSIEAYKADIILNEPMLERLMAGKDWHWYRYPNLREGNTIEIRNEIRSFLFAHNYKIAEVAMSFSDYLWNPPYARCMAKHDEANVAKLKQMYLQAADETLTQTKEQSMAAFGHEIPYVLLMHIGAFDAEMLPQLLELYRKRGYKFVSLPDAEKDPAYAKDQGVVDAGGNPIAEQLKAKNITLPRLPGHTQELADMCK